MFSLTSMLCRICGCAAKSVRGPAKTGDAEAPEANAKGPDDLKKISGIGIATENRLYSAGIRSYSELAGVTPEHLREILGKSLALAKAKGWIAAAEKLAVKK